jgi:predicted amidohydrolase YtcJ
MKRLFYLLSLGFLVSCGNPASTDKSGSAQATVYFNGDIITMEGDSAVYVEALVEKEGKITYVGNKAGALQLAGQDAREVDLGGKTLLPGFIDAHGHMVYYGKNLMDQSLSGVKDIP